MDRYLIGLARELRRRGLRVTLLHREREPLFEAHVRQTGCETLPLPDYGGVYWEQLSVPIALRRGHFQIYHAPAERGVAYLAPCPVILTYHSTTTRSYCDLLKRGLLSGNTNNYLGFNSARRWGFFEQYQWWQQFRADHVLTPSEFSRTELIRLNKLPPKRITVTPLAVADEFKRPESCRDELAATLSRLKVSRPYLLFVGGYEPHKNVRGLLQMFAHLQQRRSDVSLVCVGSNRVPQELCQYRSRLKLNDSSVRFLSSLTAELTDLYDACEAFVTLSWRETFCLPALEAMTRGVPVIAGCWGAAPEVIADAGFLVDPRDPIGASDRALTILDNPDTRSSLASKARARSLQFSWQRTAETTISVYEQVLRN